MPIPLDVCPTCHHGIKPARGWTWIDFKELTTNRECRIEAASNRYCSSCPARQVHRAGLLWIGEMYYKTPREWLKESTLMGISRAIDTVPKDFKLGETWVAVAHRKGIESPFVFGQEPTWTPAIFQIFKPSRIEYVVRGSESEKTLDAMEKRGLTLVKVEQI